MPCGLKKDEKRAEFHAEHEIPPHKKELRYYNRQTKRYRSTPCVQVVQSLTVMVTAI